MKIINNNFGFTLIELMITVAIVAILAGIGIPSYSKYIDRGKRAEARTALLDAAARQERNYSDNRQYTSTIGDGGLKITDPAGCTAGGVQTETCKYTLTTAATASNQAFTVTATPSGWTDAECEVLTINQLGVRTESGTQDKAFCWGK